MRWLVLLLAVGAVGAHNVAVEIPALRRTSLVERLRPYIGGPTSPPTASRSSSRRDLLDLGAATHPLRRLARTGDVARLEARLRRAGRPLDATGFRLRQLGSACLGLLVAASTTVALRTPVGPSVVMVVCAPALGALLPEQALRRAESERDAEIRAALPVVAEQLAMLLSAGWSLGAAVGRIARRGRGALVDDLRVVGDRTRQGLAEVAALREWAATSNVDAVTRLVDVLALHHETADLGALIAAEARTMRRDVHRDLLVAIEKRGQQVWIPVTVATLVPGLLFLAVPFVDALRLFTNP